MKAILLLMLLAAVLGDWSELKDVAAGVKNIMTNGLYTDPATGEHHLLMRDFNRGYVEHWLVSPAGEVMRKSRVTGSELWEYDYASLKSDGKSLYVLLAARDNNLAELQHMLIFTESKDGGISWSKHTHIPYFDDDDCNREGDALVLVKETGRIFLFYHKMCPGKHETLCFVTRPPNSEIFSQELEIHTIMPDNVVMAPTVSATYTMTGRKVKIHVFWGETAGLMYLASEDNGLHWTQPWVMSSYDIPYGYFPIRAEGIENSLPFLLVAYKDKAGSHYLASSTDQGGWFYYTDGPKGKDLRVEKNTRLHAVATCGTVAEPYMLWLSEDEEKNLIYTMWDLNNRKWAERVSPSTKAPEHLKYYDVTLTCSTDKATKTTTVNTFFSTRDGAKTTTYFTQEKITP